MSDGGILLSDIGGTNARFALADPAAPMPLLGDDAATYEDLLFALLTSAEFVSNH